MFEPLEIPELTQEQKYAVAEMEMKKALGALERFFAYTENPRQKAENALVEAMFPPSAFPTKEFAITFRQTLLNHFRVAPEPSDQRRREIFFYLCQGYGQIRIRRILKTSANTIVDVKKNPPSLVPVYPDWNPDLLERWNIIKKSINFLEE